METIGVGIAGAGTIGAVHAGALDEIEGAKLVAVTTTREATGRELARQLKEIFAALREGRQPPVPGEEARTAVEIILGIYWSAESGRRVTFPLEPVKKPTGPLSGGQTKEG